MSSEHKKRVAAAAVGIALLLGIYFGFGHAGLVFITTLIALGSYFEFLSFSGTLHRAPWAPVAVGTALSVWLNLGLPGEMNALYLAALALLVHGLLRAHKGSADEVKLAFRDMEARVFGLVYLIFFPSFLVRLHLEPHGPKLLVLLLGIIWLGDSGAYYGGKSFGRHKLSPNVSPGKTWEGFASNLFVCALFAALYGRWALPHLSTPVLVFVAALSSVVSQCGDLVESLAKRAYGHKDSGALIPGHGGVFDRFDSLIVAAPFFYVLLRLVS